VSFGTVSFANNSFGDIVLQCVMDWTTRVDPTNINAWGIVFKNDNGFVNNTNPCAITADFRDFTTALPTGTVISNGKFSTANTSYSGFTYLDPAGNPNSPFVITAFLSDGDQYGIRVTLHRATNATCNPTLWGVFAEEIIQ
jgi:hypothetical protein